MEAGGMTNTWNIVKEKGRLNMFDFNPDPTLRQSFWSLFVGSVISGFRLQFTQSTYQRIKATPTEKTAKRMYLIASLLFLFVSALSAMTGAVMFAYYQAKGCDPLLANQVRNPNQLMAKMLPEIFKDTPCLPGLFLAALFSASLSTMSSVFSSMSAMFWEDIVKPHTKPMSDKQAIRIAQLSVLLFGVLAIMVAFGISSIKGPIPRILDITGACMSGATLGIMLLGWFIPTANALGALIGGVVSFLFVGWVSVGKLVSSGVRVNDKLEPASTENCPRFNISVLANATEYGHIPSGIMWNGTNMVTEATQASIATGPQGLDVLYSLSYKWLLPLGMCLVFIVGPIASRFQAQKPVDPSLVVPVCDHLSSCIPEKIRKKFRCGVKYSGKDEETIKDEPDIMDELVSVPENSLKAFDDNNVC
ncbi:sodium-coupled monocarboxylate transporter 2-like [Mizuhopecten yessoensis]|uniref:sodium-coupled monocarboxylate transporter 2-like n=1 Tax=Mizuhopecten yessoensis TaxID=6573 RepID=UPI000B4571AC|nr:sodium-coupled monocarboxylate transporter 2-like [Mizuhopecten yessoensis]